MGKLAVTIKLISLLQTDRQYSSSQLAELLETSPRNIKVYIDDLRTAGIHVVGMSGRSGGYYLDGSYYFAPPNLDDKEMESFLVMEDLVQNIKGLDAGKHVVTAMAKIKHAEKMETSYGYKAAEKGPEYGTARSIWDSEDTMSDDIKAAIKVKSEIKLNCTDKVINMIPISITKYQEKTLVMGWDINERELLVINFSEISDIKIFK